jgi:hypothetical protein
VRRSANSVLAATVVAIVAAGCGKSDSSKNPSSTATSAAAPTSGATAATGAAPCPADGLWHECSILYRLERSGLAPRKDSTPANETALTERGMLVHVGSAELELFIYRDEASRAADEAKLPKGDFVDAGQPYTMRHERTLIRSANLLAILKSLRDRQRERVADAIMAGPPQPAR